MDDLIAFYRDRLDEDERSALDWQRHKQARTEQFMNDPRRQHVSPFRKPVTDAQLSEHAYHDRFDPARVLREVEAKRGRLERHARVPGTAWCSWCSRGDYMESWPCPDLATDVLAYEDHAGFLPAWRQLAERGEWQP